MVVLAVQGKVREVMMVKALISQKMQESPQLRHIAPDEVSCSSNNA